MEAVGPVYISCRPFFLGLADFKVSRKKSNGRNCKIMPFSKYLEVEDIDPTKSSQSLEPPVSFSLVLIIPYLLKVSLLTAVVDFQKLEKILCY